MDTAVFCLTFTLISSQRNAGSSTSTHNLNTGLLVPGANKSSWCKQDDPSSLELRHHAAALEMLGSVHFAIPTEVKQKQMTIYS